jgi:type III pantothenate kinase
MLLALDVGNTNTVLALYSLDAEGPGELVANWRVTTQKTQTADEFGVLIISLLSLHKIEATAVTGVIISSVVPPLDSTLRRVSERYFKIKPLFVEPGIKTGMPLLIDNPAELGADRAANGVAAFERYGGPCVIVDFGTATTFDVVSAKGEFLGGVIAPGLGISADALFSRAAKLARVNIKKPAKVIGTSTVTNLQSGIFYGYIGLVDGILARIVEELKPQSPGIAPRIVATGGLATLIADDSKYITRVDHLLTLDGLRIIYQRNMGNMGTRKRASRSRTSEEAIT